MGRVRFRSRDMARVRAKCLTSGCQSIVIQLVGYYFEWLQFCRIVSAEKKS